MIEIDIEAIAGVEPHKEISVAKFYEKVNLVKVQNIGQVIVIGNQEEVTHLKDVAQEEEAHLKEEKVPLKEALQEDIAEVILLKEAPQEGITEVVLPKGVTQKDITEVVLPKGVAQEDVAEEAVAVAVAEVMV